MFGAGRLRPRIWKAFCLKSHRSEIFKLSKDPLFVEKVRTGRFRCRCRGKRYHIPSMSTIRDVLIRVAPDKLDAASRRFNADYGLFRLAVHGLLRLPCPPSSTDA